MNTTTWGYAYFSMEFRAHWLTLCSSEHDNTVVHGLYVVVLLWNNIPPMVKPSNGRPRKTLGVSHLAMDLTQTLPQINKDMLNDIYVMQFKFSSHHSYVTNQVN